MNTVVHFQKKLDRRSQFCLGTAFVAFTLSLHGCDLFQGESDSANDGSFATNDQLSDLASIVTDINNEQDVYHAATELSFACGLGTTCESRSQLSLDVQSVSDTVTEQGSAIQVLENDVTNFTDRAAEAINNAEEAARVAVVAKGQANAALRVASELQGDVVDIDDTAKEALGKAEANETTISAITDDQTGDLANLERTYTTKINAAENNVSDSNEVLGDAEGASWSDLWGTRSVAAVIGAPNDLLTKTDSTFTINRVLRDHHEAIGYDDWVSWFGGFSIAQVIGTTEVPVPPVAPEGAVVKRFTYQNTIAETFGTTPFPSEIKDNGAAIPEGEQTITNAISKLAKQVFDLEQGDEELEGRVEELETFAQIDYFQNDENKPNLLWDWLEVTFAEYTTTEVFNTLNNFVLPTQFPFGTLPEYLEAQYLLYTDRSDFEALNDFVGPGDFNGATSLLSYLEASYASKDSVDRLAEVVGDGPLPFQNDGTATKPNTIVDVIGDMAWDNTDVLGVTLSDAINYLAGQVAANEAAIADTVNDVVNNVSAGGSVSDAIAGEISKSGTAIRQSLDDHFAPIGIEDDITNISNSIPVQLSSHVDVFSTVTSPAIPNLNSFFILHGHVNGDTGTPQKFYTWASTCRSELIEFVATVPVSCDFVIVQASPDFDYNDSTVFTFDTLGGPDPDFNDDSGEVEVVIEGSEVVIRIPYHRIVREAVAPAPARQDILAPFYSE